MVTAHFPLVTAHFPVFAHCCCHIWRPFSFSRVTITSLGILSYTTGPSPTAASCATLFTNSFPSIPRVFFTQPKCIVHYKGASFIILFLIYSINRFRLNLFCSKSEVILLSVYIAKRFSLSRPSWSPYNFSNTFKIAICSAWLLEQCHCSLNFSWCSNLPFTNIIHSAPNVASNFNAICIHFSCIYSTVFIYYLYYYYYYYLLFTYLLFTLISVILVFIMYPSWHKCVFPTIISVAKRDQVCWSARKVFFFSPCDAAAERGPWPPHFWGFLIIYTTHHSR